MEWLQRKFLKELDVNNLPYKLNLIVDNVYLLNELQLLDYSQVQYIQQFIHDNLYRIDFQVVVKKYKYIKDMLVDRVDLDEYIVQEFNKCNTFYEFNAPL